MSANGMCRHNNSIGYCPSCVKENTRRNFSGMGRNWSLQGMGACPPGYYDLKIFGVDTGQCAPGLASVTSTVQSGVTGSVVQGITGNTTNQAAALSATASSIGTAVSNFIVNQPIAAAAIAAAVIFLVIRGTK